MPLQCCALITGLLLQDGRVTSLVGLEEVEGDSGLIVVFACVIDGQLEDGVRHRQLVNVLKVLQGHGQHLIVEAAVVAKVKQDFPGLHELAHMAEVVKVRAHPEHGVRGVFKGWVLFD